MLLEQPTLMRSGHACTRLVRTPRRRSDTGRPYTPKEHAEECVTSKFKKKTTLRSFDIETDLVASVLLKQSRIGSVVVHQLSTTTEKSASF